MVNYQSLLGRQWEYGVFDCYTLMRDYFALQGVSLPNFERPEDLETCESVFLQQMPLNGFKEVDYGERCPGDILIMRLHTATPMHAAVLLPDGKILHQRTNSLSTVEVLGRYYASKVAAVFRYEADRQAAG